MDCFWGLYQKNYFVEVQGRFTCLCCCKQKKLLLLNLSFSQVDHLGLGFGWLNQRMHLLFNQVFLELCHGLIQEGFEEIILCLNFLLLSSHLIVL
jgi:hypothetical protein